MRIVPKNTPCLTCIFLIYHVVFIFSMRRILEKLWASAQAGVASMPNTSRLLAQARASLGMPVGDLFRSEEVEVPGIGGGQGRRGMREELRKARLPGVGSTETAAVGGEKKKSSEVNDEEGGGSQQESRFLETYVFLEEFLKEIFCALSAKSNVESDAQGLSESYARQRCIELRAEMVRSLSVDEGEGGASPVADCGDLGAGGRGNSTASEVRERGVSGCGAEVADLPTSLDEFLREAAFPIFSTTPV